MEVLKSLYKFAEQESIHILSSRHINKKAFCFKVDDKLAVSIDFSKVNNEREEGCLLAEELGHCDCGTLYYLEDYYNPLYLSNISKSERKAKDWALKKLVPYESLKSALKTTKEIYELAELLNVDEQTLREALDFYKRKNLLF